MPLNDIRAVIIAARGLTLSSNFLSGRLETDATALHGDERHQPCGWTAPLARVVKLKTSQNQTANPPGRSSALHSLRLFQKFDELFHQGGQFPALASLLTATERRARGFGFMRYVPAKNSCQFDLPSPSAASDTSQNISSNIVQ